MTEPKDIALGMAADADTFVREMDDEPDRSVAIIGGSLVEAALTQALVASLHADEDLSHELFQPSGPAGFFHAKIDLGKLTGLYGEAAHRDLTIIKEIRNDFAHKPEVETFDDQRVCALAGNLTLAERHVGGPGASADADDGTPLSERAVWFTAERRDTLMLSPRGRFILSVLALVFALSRAGAGRMPPPAF